MPRKKASSQKNGRRYLSPFRPIMLVHMYRLVRLGFTEQAICDEIDINQNTLIKWKTTRPEVAEALAMARRELSSQEDFAAYCYNRLSPELKQLWDHIMAWGELENGQGKIQALLQDHGETTRQQLYLHALIHCRFSATKAAAMVNIDMDLVRRWARDIPEFSELVQEIYQAKKDFFEESLIKLVQSGNPSAVIFANRTVNRDRGYGVVHKVELNGQIEHTHNQLDLDELLKDVSPSARVEVLLAIRRREDRRVLKPPVPEQIQLLEHIQDEIATLPEEEEKEVKD